MVFRVRLTGISQFRWHVPGSFFSATFVFSTPYDIAHVVQRRTDFECQGNLPGIFLGARQRNSSLPVNGNLTVTGSGLIN